ncbi:MAG: hypothetical protein OZSIB_0789 [Candidatus Ozemobacter sibiricus]|jgi:hypothetical protein|uniref:FtsH ternary systems vWA domain-containing protein n=1 Tax=Candidatus Ozemobacter sibiricus TaxID=2268124 RepID=A0A367ZU29_9BACT|nr:MAG: hypothetical protein OZSIB_0789 [Candidatus Ozemobacter sibiricus]
MALLSRPEIAAWLNASLEASGFRQLEPLPLRIWKEAVRAGKNALPPGFFGLLWERLTHKTAGPHRERTGLPAEDELLTRLTRLPGFEHLEGLFILRGARPSEDFIAGVLAQVIDRLPGFHHAVVQMASLDLEHVLDHPTAPDPAFPATRHLQTIYQDALSRLAAAPLTLTPTDLFEIGHPHLFRSPADRTFYRRMMAAVNGLAHWATGVFTLKEESATVVAQFGEPQILPLGGYDSLTTKGDISSLLSSELGFIDEEMEVDLFDLKYCENQLLYFKREEGAVFRIRRDITVDLELTPFFEHERHLGLLFAWCFVLADRLMETFVKDAVRLFFQFRGFMPSAFREACAFFRFFLEEKGIFKRIFLSAHGDPPADFQSPRTQGWKLGGPPDPRVKHIPFSFPQTDAFAAADPREQEQELGLSIVQILKQMIGHADR